MQMYTKMTCTFRTCRYLKVPVVFQTSYYTLSEVGTGQASFFFVHYCYLQFKKGPCITLIQPLWYLKILYYSSAIALFAVSLIGQVHLSLSLFILCENFLECEHTEGFLLLLTYPIAVNHPLTLIAVNLRRLFWRIRPWNKTGFSVLKVQTIDW